MEYEVRVTGRTSRGIEFSICTIVNSIDRISGWVRSGIEFLGGSWEKIEILKEKVIVVYEYKNPEVKC